MQSYSSTRHTLLEHSAKCLDHSLPIVAATSLQTAAQQALKALLEGYSSLPTTMTQS